VSGFSEAFLPDIGSFIDFDRIEFIDKERFTSEGRRRTGDLLIKTTFRDEEAAFLIHLEHEAQARAGLSLRMLEYLVLDWRDFDLPVYPIAVLSSPEPNPFAVSPVRLRVRGEEILFFRYAVIDLGRLEAREYAKKLNAAAMALSSRMRTDPTGKVDLALDFIRSASTAGIGEMELDAASRFFFAYKRFSREEGLKLQRELGRIGDMEIPKEVLLRNPLVQFGMNKGLSKGRNEGLNEGRRRGINEGRQQGETELVLRLLSRRLGKIAAAQEKAIRKLPLSRIESLGEALLDFRSKTDLTRWLKSKP
jgi:hypothetical protein